jgi:sulfur carrier protein ThiS
MSKNKEIELLKIQSPFDRKKVLKTVIPYQFQKLSDIVENYMPDDINFAVSVNGEIVEKENWSDYYLLQTDQVVVIPLVAGDDIFQMVALVALFVFAPQIAVAIGGPAAGTVGALSTFGQFLTAGILLGGGMLINSLGPSPSTPSLGLGQDADVSQFHSFNPSTKQRQGLVVPRIFGKNKVYGNVIATHTELNEDNDKQILNTLIAISKGPIKGIVDYVDPDDAGEVKINNQPVENFQNVTVEHRIGTMEQDIVPFFDDTLVENIVDTLISSSSPVVYTTTNGNFDELEIKIGAPAGVFYQNDQNGLDSHSIDIKIEIKETISGTYATLFDGSITDNRNALVKRTYRTIDSDSITIVNGENYDIRITKVSADETSVRYADTIRLSSVSEVLTDDFIYPGLSLVGLKALATDQLSGSLNFSAIAEGSICKVWDGFSFSNEYTNNPAWVMYNILSSPVFSGESEGNYVVARYDGVDPSQLDIDSFFELAQYCDELVPISEDAPEIKEKRFVFNGGFDSESSIWESALTVCKMCRSALVFNGTTIKVITDKPTETTQMFGMGNIIKGSFKENFPPMSERASEIEINFLDEESDYNKTPFTIFNTSLENKTNKVSIDLVGCTKQSQAWRHGQYILRQNLALTKTIEFQTGIDSLACQIGDVIDFSHDVPRWNQSGRVIDATSTTVILSEEFVEDDPSSGGSYQITVRLSDDTLVTKDVLSIEGDVVTVTTPFSEIPATDDIYQIGLEETVHNEFRVTEIVRSGEQNAKISGIEYNEFVYSGDDSGAELPTDYTYIDNPDDILVTNLELTESVNISESGVIQRNILVSYDLPPSASFYQTQIFVRIDGVPYFDFAGTTTYGNWIIPGVLESTNYEVKVISQLNNFKTSPFDSSPGDFITTGSNDDLDSVLLTVTMTGLEVEGGSTTEWTGKDVALVWDALPTDNPSEPTTSGFWNTVPDNFIQDYEVKIYNFGGNLRRTENVLEPRYTYTYENNVEDGAGTPSRNLRIELKMRDKFGRVSETPTVLTQIQNPVPVILGGVVDTEAGKVSVISWDESGEIDVINGGGYKLWASQTSPVDTSDDDDLVYKGPNTSFSFSQSTLGVWYYKVAAYDSFDETISTPTQFSTTLSAGEFTADYPIRSGFTWGTDSTNITWSAGTLSYKGTDYAISSGATTGGNQFVYWDFDNLNTTFKHAASLSTVIADDGWVMAQNIGGVVNESTGFKTLHAGILQADSITANGAQIANATIDTAQIANAAITTAKIGDAEITSAKIGNLQVKTANIEDLTVNGQKIANNAVTNTASTFTAGSVSLSPSSYTTVCSSGSITPRGDRVQLSFMCRLFGNFAWFGVYRNGTEILDLSSGETQAFGVVATPITVNFVDESPGTSAVTYTLKAKEIAAGSGNCINRLGIATDLAK